MEFKIGDRFVLKSMATEYELTEIVPNKIKDDRMVICLPVDKTFTIINKDKEEVVIDRQPIKTKMKDLRMIIESGIIKQIK